MRRILAISLAAALVALVAGLAQAQPTQKARGTVTALSADSITISAGDKPMTFMVDAKTVVTASGAGTASRAAEAAGKAGPKLAEVLKVGEAVEVEYHDMGGKLHAANVRRTRTPGAGGGGVTTEDKTEMANGTVEAVTATSLSIAGSGGGGASFKQTFTIDQQTKVIGRGAGTAAAKGKVTAPDLVAVGDRVSVSYHKMGDTLHAAEIRVTQQKK
jgi:uncharacterized protein DUF5666